MTEVFSLGAASLSNHQRCRRLPLLAADYSVLRPRPKRLFDRLLRAGVRMLSASGSSDDVTSALRADFLSVAASPGLDVPSGTAVYTVAKDWTTLLSTVVTSIARSSVPVLHDAAPVRLSSSLQWLPSSPADDSGELHRWVSADSFTDGDLARELHSWAVSGDVCILRVPLTLHVVVIGQSRSGRRASPWTRIYHHPALRNLAPHFVAKSGLPLKGWRPEWLSDRAHPDYDDWVEQMHREGVADGLIREYKVNVPAEAACAATVRQVIAEGMTMASALAERASSPWHVWPMSRPACDGFVPCPWQDCCYSSETDPTATGLYEIRARESRPAPLNPAAPMADTVPTRRPDGQR